jgi:hypothetical protein
LVNSVEDNRFTKRNASERHLKSAFPNTKNNNHYSGLVYNNQTIQNSGNNSSNQMLNSTQQGLNTNVIIINKILIIFFLNFLFLK